MNHNRAHAVPLRLIDGPLVYIHDAEREQTLQRMADILTADGVPLDDKRSCVACLLRNGFHSLKVALLVDDVRPLAFQGVVAREMADG